MKNKSTTKKRLNVGLSLALVAVLVIGVTLALLSTRTDELVNNFQIVGDLDVSIKETFDEDEGANMVPGVSVDKKPWMTNDSDMDVYVAMQVLLVAGNGDPYDPQDILDDTQYAKLMSMIAIRYDDTVTTTNYNTGTGKWAYADTVLTDSKNETIFVYETTLKPGDDTEVLFNEVEILKGADVEWIRDELDGFQIILRGAGVQADGMSDLTEAAAALVDLFD